ncbi:MAG: signal peptidase II, partial [Lysobacter sp.]|nr:signal peptidase II [Lysobacter sp.]
VLWHNPGAAFSFLAGAGGWQRWFFVGVTVVVSAVLLAMLRKSGGNRLLAAALALVLGGAAGNLWDRLTLGHVVDFIQLHAAGYYWPAFNVADSAITVGVVLILWDGVRDTLAERRQERKPPDA